MPISLVRQASNSASAASVAVAIAGGGGDTLVAIGQLYTGGGSDAYLSGITDTAGNTWQLSTALTPNPAAAVVPGNHFGLFIAWCIGAAAVTSVTFNAPNAAFMSVSVSEWSGIGSETAGNYTQASTLTEVLSPSLSVPAGGLMIAGAYPSSGSGLGSAPPGSTALTVPAGNANWFCYEVFAGSGPESFDWGFTDNPWVTVGAVFAPPASGQTVAGAVSPLALAAPAGTVMFPGSAAGVVAPLVLSALAGTVQVTGAATVSGPVAGLVLPAPAGAPFVPRGGVLPPADYDRPGLLRKPFLW